MDAESHQPVHRAKFIAHYCASEFPQAVILSTLIMKGTEELFLPLFIFNLICQFDVFLVVNREGIAFIQKTVQSRKLSDIL